MDGTNQTNENQQAPMSENDIIEIIGVLDESLMMIMTLTNRVWRDGSQDN
jgi:hypothetical protein